MRQPAREKLPAVSATPGLNVGSPPARPCTGNPDHHWMGVNGAITHYGGMIYDELHCVHCGSHYQLAEPDDFAMGVFGSESVLLEERLSTHDPCCFSGRSPACRGCKAPFFKKSLSAKPFFS